MNQHINLIENFQIDLDMIRNSATNEEAIKNLTILFQKLRFSDLTKEIIIKLQNEIREKRIEIITIRKEYFEWCCEKLLQLKSIFQTNINIQNSDDFCYQIDKIIKFDFEYEPRNLFDILNDIILKMVKTIFKYDKESYFLLSNWVKIHCILDDKDEKIEIITPYHNLPFPYLIEYLEKPDKWEMIMDSWLLSILFLVETLIRCNPLNVPLIIDFTKPVNKKSNHSFIEMENNIIFSNCGLFLINHNPFIYYKNFFGMHHISMLSENLLNLLQKEIEVNDNSLKKGNPKHWKTRQKEEDENAIMPFAKKKWVKTLEKCEYPFQIGVESLAQELIKELSSTLSLNVDGEKRLPRIKNALKLTDPRIFENGKYKGLKPHWEKFAWLNS